ncbi:hypothetical protein UPYG_G00168700 [Umbra pygmaea]|uniref:Uncharacterized protein n=1 Tax=Umbra pygmaea TaxID=75934 RepID=A0ABD0WNH1_UMBPY
MDSSPLIRRVLFRNDGSSHQNLTREFVRSNPPPSPSPHVPDITENRTGLEWFEGLATANGPARSTTDQGVPRSPYVVGSVSSQISPLTTSTQGCDVGEL